MRRVLTMMTTTLVLLLSGCAGSREALWTSPPQLQLSADQVFGAALTAGEKNSFTIAKANHESGVISMEQTTGGGRTGIAGSTCW